MTLKGLIDRNIIKRVAIFILMRMGTVVTVWLSAHGVPGDLLEQLVAAAIALLGISLEILWTYIDRQKAKDEGARSLLDAQGKTNLDDDWWEDLRSEPNPLAPLLRAGNPQNSRDYKGGFL